MFTKTQNSSERLAAWRKFRQEFPANGTADDVINAFSKIKIDRRRFQALIFCLASLYSATPRVFCIKAKENNIIQWMKKEFYDRLKLCNSQIIVLLFFLKQT